MSREGKRTGERRATARGSLRTRLRRARGETGRRAVALALTVVLGLETLFSSGVTIALAEALNTGDEGQASTQLVVDDSSTLQASAEEGQLSNDQENGAGGSSKNDNPDGLGEETTDPTSDGTDEPANEAEQDGESANGEDETVAGDEGQAPAEDDQAEAPAEGDGSEGEQNPATTPEQNPAADSEQDSAAAPEPTVVDPWDWTGRTDNLVLSSESGLTFAEGAVPSTDAPLDATLSLNLSLDPSVEGTDVGDHTVVVPGDTLRVALPEGVSLAPDAKLDVFQLDEEGNPTTVRVAEATAEDDGATLVITFVEPTDTETGDLYYVGDPTEGTEPAAQAEGKTQLAAIDATLELPVTVGAELFGEEPAQLEWTLQTDADDPAVTQTATLELPALPAEDAERGETPEQGAEQEEESAEENAAETEGASDEFRQRLLTPFSNSEQLVSHALSNYSASVEMTVTWCDNNSSSRPTTADWAKGIDILFQIDGGKPVNLLAANGTLTDSARGALHIAEDVNPSWVHFASVVPTSTSSWSIDLSGLPTTLTETTGTPTGDYLPSGEPEYEYTTTEHTITWKIVDNNQTPSGYVLGENDKGESGSQRYFMRTQDFTFTISGKLGGQSLQGVFGQEFNDKTYAASFQLGASINNQTVADDEGNARTISLAELLGSESGRYTVTYNEDGDAVITLTLPMYDESNQPIVYNITYTDPHDPSSGADYYQPTYNNSSSANHGSATDALYDGGTMTLRPMGTTTYDAEKAWLDGNSTNRPEVTFTLWRYSTAPGSGPSTAAQVQLNAIEGDTETNAIEYVTVTVPADSENTVDLGDLLADKYGDSASNVLSGLPKYDPDGYEYVYGLREDTNLAGYETVYGTVDNAGAVSDTPPSNASSDWTRPSNDPFVYNTGTVTNRLYGNVTVEGTKSWEIAAFQDSLGDVTVEFTAQSRKKATEGNALFGLLTVEDEWQDTEHTITVDGWISEALTQSFSATLPKYDAWGNELEWRWVESGITVDGQPVTFTPDDNGGGTFTLTLVNAEGEDETLEFTSTLTEQEDGSSLITNTFDNTTYELVDKLWQQPDGTFAPIKPADDGYPDHPDLDTDGRVTMELFQNGNSVFTYEMDGQTDQAATTIDALGNDVTVQETSSYHLEFTNLPKYDDNGVRYSYLVLEQGVRGWHSERTYDATTHTTTITNAVGPGEGSEIRVMKEWIDASDAAHRLDTVVQLVALRDMQSQTLGEDGQPLYSYEKGDVVAVFGSAGIVDSENNIITLSAGDSWFAEVDVPIGGLTYKDFEVVELYLVDENGTQYPVTTKDDAATDYENINIDKGWINTGWSYDSTTSTSRVATPDHVYQVYAVEDRTGEYNDAMDAVVARNRRLGLFDLTVTKTWEDGVDPQRPAAELVLSCVEGSATFSEDVSGDIMVQLTGGNTVPVMNGNGEDARPLNTETDGVRIEDNTLVMPVSAANGGATSEYHFFGLPKYDGAGNVVHYDVTERWVGDAGEYVSSKSVEDYVVGAQHFHDSQTISFTNTRQGTRSVTFYKNWNDNYVNEELSQRPDIYLTLYRVTVSRGENGQAVYSDPVVIPDHVNYLWAPTVGGGSPQYDQTCTIDGLAKYDSDGNEYIYYARETMSVADNGASLDYAPVRFDYSTIAPEDPGDPVETGKEELAVWVGSGDSSGDPQEDGTNWAIHEDGTFVNQLTSNLTARGTKLWEDVPGEFEQSDLPSLTVYLQRKNADGSWPQLTFTKAADGTWVPGEGQVVAWTSDLHEVTTNQYTYIIGHTGENSLDSEGNLIDAEGAQDIPRYDEDGTLYEYRAVEVPWGLYNQPGGFADKDLELTNGVTKDFGALHDSENDLGVVIVAHGEAGSFVLHNTYASEKGNLTVKKTFEGDRIDGDAYPNTTFSVYRYYVDAEGNKSDPAFVTGITLPSAWFQDSANKESDGSYAYTFGDLDVYAPDGSFWQYYVVEDGIYGYTATVTVGGESSTADAAGKDLQSPDLCPVEDNGQVSGTVIKNDEDVDVAFSNEYKPESTDLSGTKTWNDFNNVFGLRPTADEFLSGLSVQRSGNGGQPEDVETQSGNPDGDNYLNVTAGATPGTYTITLNNVERWAPDGTAWRYTITEDLSGMEIASTDDASDSAGTYYETTSDSSTVTAGSGSSFSLTNSFSGEVSVMKAWEDGDNPYGLRPETVTVRLQARTGSSGDWSDAYALFKDLVSESALTQAGVTDDYFTRELSDVNGWRASWTGLPLYDVDADGDVSQIQYRVVEVEIGDQVIDQPTAPATEERASIYATYTPYQPYQTDGGDAENGFTSTVTNVLKGTSITTTKSWSGDTGDAWGTRGSGSNWSVTYFLQSRIGQGDWEWVVRTGSAPADSPEDAGVVSHTVTGADTTDSGTYTWNNLPQFDTDSKEYEYRVVERVPGSYDVTGIAAEQVEVSGSSYRYYVVSSTDGADGTSTQTFTNTLRTVDLTGTKAWEDYGTTLADSLTKEDMPEMTLHRSVNGGSDEDVTRYAGQPEWNPNGDGTWTFTYEDLPAADATDRPYTYWAEEVPGSADGFYPTYGTSGAGGTTTNGDQQTGTTITNVATRLTLDKVSDFQGDTEDFEGVELRVVSADGNTTYATWKKGGNGTVTTNTWVTGTTDPGDTSGATVRTDGLIVGLKAGTYKVVEVESTVPEGYALADPVSFTINDDGTAVAANDVETTTADGRHVINVTVEDPVLRGHLRLTKFVSEDGVQSGDGLEGAEFDLYCEGYEEPIATGLTSDADGYVATNGGSNRSIQLSSEFVSANGNKYLTLGDGLPIGNYCFVETDATPGAVLPDEDETDPTKDRTSDTLEITSSNHYDHAGFVEETMGNVDFSATVTLRKYDTVTNLGIEGAEFSLKYTPEGSGSSTTRTVRTDQDGNLVLTGLEKGEYLLEETINKGYEAPTFSAEFTLDDHDNGVFDMTQADDRTAIDFTVTSANGTFNDSGIPNTPLTGSVTMTKTGMNGAALDGATFKLVSIASDGTETTVPGASALVTGNNYEMSNGTVSMVGGGTTGQITVSGLPWGTYKYVETGSLDGYVGVDEQNPAESSPATIDRDHGLVGQTAVSAGTVTNEPTRLELYKRNEADQSLDGATFRVTPVGGSTFADGSTEPIEDVTSNGGGMEIVGKLVVGGIYEIYEQHGPTGYDPVDATFCVRVENDGSLTVVDADGTPATLPEGWSQQTVGSNEYAFIATNKHMNIEVTKVSSKDGTPLEGVEFELSGIQFMTPGNTTRSYTTNADGVIEVDAGLLEGVRYTLREVSTPDGYVQMDALAFTMNERGEIVVNGTAPDGWTIGEDDISLTAENDPVELQITKVSPGADGKPLEGAVFSVTPADGSEFADGSTTAIELTTNGKGVATSTAQLVVGGTYDITETSAPAGYELVSGTMRVTVAEDGTINAVGQVPTGYTKVAGNAFEVQVVNQPIEIGIHKVNADDTATPLPGATFVIEGEFADGETSKTVTTDSDGNLSLSAVLESGQTYKLRETVAPSGFELIEGTLTFEVMSDGTIRAVDPVPTGLDIYVNAANPDDPQNNVTIWAENEPIEVTFTKADLSGDPISGTAEFTISGEFVNDATHAVSQQEIAFTTTGDQQVKLAGMTHEGASYSLVAGKTYTVEETLAPSGYELVAPFSFTVNEDGTIVVASGSAERVDGEPGFAIANDGATVTLTAYDRPIEVTLAKTNGSAPLSDATFSLYQGTSVEDGTLLADDVVTGQDGTVELTGLVGAQTYTLRETKAPAGYELVADVTFSVANDGSVTLEGEPAGWAVSDSAGAITITATDVPIEARLMKTDAEGSPLAGAGFEVVPAAGSSFAGSPELNENGALELGPTDENGVVEVPAGVLVAGDTYRLTEVLAPGGYELAGTVEFTVGTDGSLAIVGSSEGAPLAGADGSGTYAASAEDGVAVITATDSLTELTVMKAAIDEDGEKTYLSGAEFTLTELLGRGTEAAEGADGSAAEPQVLTGTTDESGRVTWTGLKANTSYVLEETDAPAGFELLDDTLTIVVAPDGTVTAADGNASGAFTIGSDGVSVEAIDRHLGVSLVKTSLDGTGLAGGTFTLAPVEGTFPDGDTEKTFVSDEFGAVFTDLALTGSAEGTAYVLTEVTAPAGFETNDQITLLVYEDGTVGLGSDVTGELAERVAIVNDAADGVAVVTVSDVPIEASISKVSTEGGSLTGAEFEVTGLFANGDAPESRTVVVGEDGTAPIEGLVAGETYAIRETVAPEGFDLIEGAWSFTVATDGTLAPAEGTEAATEGAVGYRVADGGVTLVATDAPTPPVETPPVETPPDDPKLPDTSDATRPTLAVTMAAAGVALLAAAMAHLRRERQKRS